MLTILWAGAPTYVTNTLKNKNPFFPLMGEGSIDIMSLNSPASFLNKPNIYKLFFSIFGRFENTCVMMGDDGKLPEIKIPFTFSLEEIGRFRVLQPDTRISGFGLFFGGILIFSFIFFFY